MEPRDEALAERFEAALEQIGECFLVSSPLQNAAAVRIDFLVEGDYPGDGKPKPGRFPSPATAGVEAGRFRVLALPRFIELKLASGMTAPHRLQDLADVLRLIAAAKLPRELGQSLDLYVRGKYDELWQAAQHPEDDY